MVRKTLTLLQEFSIPLIAGVVAALIWANTSHESYDALVHWSPFGEHHAFTFHFLFNDIFMVFFFGIAAKEIVESCLPGGALNPPKKAVNPLLATAGGVLGPIGVYILWKTLTGDDSIEKGWGIPTATDIAMAWLIARVVFGKGHPAINFLLLLAVADDGIGLGIIAIFYPDPAHPVRPEMLLFVVAAMLLAWGFRRRHIQSFWIYVLGPGTLSWLGLYAGHLHPALALVFIVPLMPSARQDEGLFAEDFHTHRYTDTLNSFEHFFKGIVDFGLFGFGLANAGVMFESVGNATWAVFVSLFVGKTVGISLFSIVGTWLGFPLPTGMTLASLFMAGMVASLGLTVALFVAGVAFTDPDLQGAAKMGALLSGCTIPIMIVLGRILKVKKIAPAITPPKADEQANPIREVRV